MSLKQLRASLALWRGRYAYRTMRLRFWERLHNKAGIAKWTKLQAEAKATIHLRIRQIKEAESAKPITMYDSVNPDRIPADAEAVAGYVNGNYVTYPTLVRKFPKARKKSIAVNASADADILDVESGDATIADTVPWFRRQKARGAERPGFYIETSRLAELVAHLAAAGIARGEYVIWSAHYTGVPHIEPGSDATQYREDKAQDLDYSLCHPSFF